VKIFKTMKKIRKEMSGGNAIRRGRSWEFGHSMVKKDNSNEAKET
jgi:hypothetical protein